MVVWLQLTTQTHKIFSCILPPTTLLCISMDRWLVISKFFIPLFFLQFSTMIICFMVGKQCLLCAHFYGVSHCVLFRKYRNDQVCCINRRWPHHFALLCHIGFHDCIRTNGYRKKSPYWLPIRYVSVHQYTPAYNKPAILHSQDAQHSSTCALCSVVIN